MKLSELPTPDNINALYQQAEEAVSALFERQAKIILDLGAKLRGPDAQVAKNTQNSSRMPPSDSLNKPLPPS